MGAYQWGRAYYGSFDYPINWQCYIKCMLNSTHYQCLLTVTRVNFWFDCFLSKIGGPTNCHSVTDKTNLPDQNNNMNRTNFPADGEVIITTATNPGPQTWHV